MDNIKSTVKAFILEEFLPGENPAELTDAVPLISDGILDSLATLKLVFFLEEQFGFEVQPHEVSSDNLNTISDIADFVNSKIGVSQ